MIDASEENVAAIKRALAALPDNATADIRQVDKEIRSSNRDALAGAGDPIPVDNPDP